MAASKEVIMAKLEVADTAAMQNNDFVTGVLIEALFWLVEKQGKDNKDIGFKDEKKA